MENTITINRQDTWARTINLIDASGDPIDATGWTIYFTVRESVAATSTTSDTDAIIHKTVSGQSSGIQTLTLSSTDTDVDPDTYIYDFQIKKGDGTISSSTRASFIVSGDVTRST